MKSPRDGRPGLGDHMRPLLQPKRIDISQEYEIQYWSRAFGVAREALLAAVSEVGPDARAVSTRLGKG
ncbi:MAG TPA: DUF3606 domain-containing protein [Caulobacteraceae bacterium]|jgi:hypothetical protein